MTDLSTSETTSCLEPGVHDNSVVALDITDGYMNWAVHLGPKDSWIVSCGVVGLYARNSTLCPQTPGPDADFGQAPMFIKGSENTPLGRNVVVVGQKSGVIWCFFAQTGNLMWVTMVAPGGAAGGLLLGSATDGKNVYFASENSNKINYTTALGQRINGVGSWGAVTLKNGSVIWIYPNPYTGAGHGPVAVGGGVVWGGSTDTGGHLFAFNAENGNLLKNFSLGAPVYGGLSIGENAVYIGSGYNTASNNKGKLFAISVVN